MHPMLSLPSTSEIAEIRVCLVYLRVRSDGLANEGRNESEVPALCRSLRRLSMNHHSMRRSAAKQAHMHYHAADSSVALP